MKPRRTIASNHVLTLEGGNEDNDLWVTVGQAEEDVPVMCSTWELTAEERERIAAGENVELIVFGAAHPPVQMRLTNVPIGGSIDPKEVADRLRGMGNDALAELFETKTADELKEELAGWDLPEPLGKEVLAFVQLLGDGESDLDRDVGGVAPELEESPPADEWPYDDDPPDPL